MQRGVKRSSIRRMTFTLTCASFIGISGCSGTGGANDFCLIAEPIPNSTKNVEVTRKAVDAHNLVGVRLCGW